MKADEKLAELQSSLEELEQQVEADIQDVRDRVVQVKREADAKAAADHEHESLQNQITALESELASTRESLDETEEQMQGGFENFEEILETLLQRTRNLESDVETIGEATRSLRSLVDTIATREQNRTRADHLKRTAAARGVRRANCESCNKTVDIALLSTPSCPSCNANFHTLDANPGFFGTSVLETGEQPALEDGEAEPRPDLESVGDETPTNESDTSMSWAGEDGENRQ